MNDLKLWARKALECSKQRFIGHSGKSLEDQNTVRKDESGNQAHESPGV